MRPTKLQIEGFGSFKEPTEVDFEGAEFFALVGPTGSGKSTIIDAICFALYGSIPRYENRNLVAPVISQGKLEAKVRLDFTANGDAFTAIRVVRRSGKGATTKEARLERNGEPEVSGPDELTEAVGNLLGLGFDHFTKCVVLPQGEFARFLHDKPADRQGLVVKLLNLGIYEVMGQLARQREAERKVEMQGCEQQLRDIEAWASADRVKELKERATRLERLRKDATDRLPKIQKLTDTEREAAKRSEDARVWIGRLNKLEIPKDLDALADELTSAEKLVEESEKIVAAAKKDAAAAEKTLAALGDRRPLDRALTAHEKRAGVLDELGPAEKLLEKAIAAVEATRTAVVQSEAGESSARDEEKRLQIEHRAQHLASVLEKGEPCPVCLQTVAQLPKHPEVPDLKKAAKALQDASSAVNKARTALEKATREASNVEGKVAALRAQIESLDADIAEHPDADALAATLKKIEVAERAAARAREAEGRARDEAETARKSLDAVKTKQTRSRELLEEARFSLAPLEPPKPMKRSLVEDWEALVSWGDERSAVLQKEETKAGNDAEGARTARGEIVDALLESCVECELDVSDESQVLEAIAAHTASVGAERSRVEEAIEKADELRLRTASLTLDVETAGALGLHLSKGLGRFPGWVVNAALKRLVEGATLILDQLSQSQYALTTDEQGNFLVVDRNNANEKRSARTLSGGETFLASLALALALSDQLADLAAEGASRLEAIFLDEGFGTLDPETLDTVAATVENLAASGRMVGIVTHVRELAERVPLQFRVRKSAGSSTIEKAIA